MEIGINRVRRLIIMPQMSAKLPLLGSIHAPQVGSGKDAMTVSQIPSGKLSEQEWEALSAELAIVYS